MSAGDIGNHPGAATAAVADGGSKRSYPKTHVNFWKARLEHRTYTRAGKTFEVAEWSVRIHFKGLRKSFDLDTANKEEAAVKARDIYLSLLAKGWFTTINELTPQAARPAETSSDCATIGEFLAEVSPGALFPQRLCGQPIEPAAGGGGVELTQVAASGGTFLAPNAPRLLCAGAVPSLCRRSV